MENDNHEEYGNPRNTGRRGLQVEAHYRGIEEHVENDNRGIREPKKHGETRTTS